MAAPKAKRFYKTYEKALKAHLARKSGATKSWSARRIGKEAVARKVSLIEFAQIHDQAVSRLQPKESLRATKVVADHPVSLAALFFIEALVPLEQVREAEQFKLKQVEQKLETQIRDENERHDKLLEDAQRQKLQVRRLTHQFLLAQEEERKEISRELHDEIAQVLAGINVRLAALKKVVQVGQGDVGERIDQTQVLVEQSVAAVHRYALRLRPSLLDDLGLIPTLRSYTSTLSEHYSMNIEFEATRGSDLLGNQQCTALYRVAQEALTNVIRHSRAKNARVSLRKVKRMIRLEIQDDGRGFEAKRILNSMTHKRLGILGMRERVKMFDGAFSISSSASKGTTVTAELPCDDKPTKAA